MSSYSPLKRKISVTLYLGLLLLRGPVTVVAMSVHVRAAV